MTLTARPKISTRKPAGKRPMVKKATTKRKPAKKTTLKRKPSQPRRKKAEVVEPVYPTGLYEFIECFFGNTRMELEASRAKQHKEYKTETKVILFSVFIILPIAALLTVLFLRSLEL